MRKLFIKYSFLVVVAIAIVGCMPKSPVFKDISKLKATSITKEAVVFSGAANFFNPNKFGVMLKKVQLTVEKDKKEIVKIGQTHKYKIKSNTDFSVPLEFKVKPTDIFDGSNGLTSLFKAKKIELSLNGNIRLRKWIGFGTSFKKKKIIKLR